MPPSLFYDDTCTIMEPLLLPPSPPTVRQKPRVQDWNQDSDVGLKGVIINNFKQVRCEGLTAQEFLVAFLNDEKGGLAKCFRTGPATLSKQGWLFCVRIHRHAGKEKLLLPLETIIRTAWLYHCVPVSARQE